MAFDLSKHSKEKRKGTVEFPDGSQLNFEFYPHYFTPRFEREAKSIDVEKDGSGTVLKGWLLPLLASWDVVITKEDSDTGVFLEVPVPITDEGMDEVPVKVLGMILDSITGSMSPGEETGSQSSSSSASAT